MADVREFIILDSRAVPVGRPGALLRCLAAARLALRRVVLHTAKLPGFRAFYVKVYQFHIAVASRLARRFAGTRAIYVAAGVGRGELKPGISDIDMVVLGDWPEPKQIQLLKALAVVVLLMPLFDRESLGAILTWDDFLKLNETDLILAFHYAAAKTKWTLVWGEDLVQQLPELSPERRVGASYMHAMVWWANFIRMATGDSVVSTDTVFRNSLSFKTVAEMLRVKIMATGGSVPSRRTEMLQAGLRGRDDALLERLLAADRANFLKADGDLREVVGAWIQPNLERILGDFAATPALGPLRTPHVLGRADDLFLSAATRHHVEEVAEGAASLPGFEAASLVPCTLFLSPDSLALVLRFAPGRTFTMGELRAFLGPHLRVAASLPERVCVYLLRERAAYMLDPIFGLEVWAFVLTPEVNPDLFLLLERPEFTVRGTPAGRTWPAGWCSVSEQTLAEERMVRQGAYRRMGLRSRPTVLDNLRNFWRFLQLHAISASAGDSIMLPVTLKAVTELLCAAQPELEQDLAFLLRAFQDAKAGRTAPGMEAAMDRAYAGLACSDPVSSLPEPQNRQPNRHHVS